MAERIVNSTWWLALMGMIVATGGAGLLLAYRALFDAIAGRCTDAVVFATIGIVCACAAIKLCRHRNDLI